MIGSYSHSYSLLTSMNSLLLKNLPLGKELAVPQQMTKSLNA
jgi:hypothetical protein